MSLAALSSILAAVLLAPGCQAPAARSNQDASGGIETEARIPAFPGAEGFGAYTVGGRGGDVYLVTTLEDYGEDDAPIEGSLRAAVEAKGPRNVVFRVSGYIDLVRTLDIREPYLTIAGQTAPGDGITLRRFGVDVAAPQTIIRHLRVRPGDVAGIEQDAVNVRASDVILDHCSTSWGTDETLSVIDEATNVTVQWCIISESLHRSVHSKGPHGYGSLLTATGDVSIHHNAYVLHYSRNSRPKSLLLDFRNNLIYGYGGQAGYNADDTTRMNYVGNFIQPLDHSNKDDCAFNLGGLRSRIYAADNRIVGQDDGGWEVICFDGVDPEEAEERVRLKSPISVAYVTTHTADEARELILQNAGATLPRRDAVDERILGMIDRGEGRIIDSQEEVGGWPGLEAAEAPADADRDGLPDEWERAHGLDPNDPSDQALDADGDGYTNLEEYFNGTDPQVPKASRSSSI